MKAALGRLKATLGEAHLKTVNAMQSLGICYLALNQAAQAEPILREHLSRCNDANPDGWAAFNARALLGEGLLGGGKFAEAEPLLRDGYQGMKARGGKIQPQFRDLRLTQTLDRLIALAEAAGKPDEAEAWRAEKVKLAAAPPTPQ